MLQFPLQNFDAYCQDLHKLKLDPGYLMYANRHAGNDQPAARLIPPNQLEAALAHIDAPSDDTFKRLVRQGVVVGHGVGSQHRKLGDHFFRRLGSAAQGLLSLEHAG